MTQEQWDHVQDLLNYKEILKIERTRLSDEIWAIDNSLSKNFKEISSVCDCKTPDGTGTWADKFSFSECTICGRNDL
jgi:hypothetical protein